MLDANLAELAGERTLVVSHPRAGARRARSRPRSSRCDATSPTSPRWRARTCCSSCARATPCRRCSCSSSRRSSSSASRCRPTRPISPRSGSSGSPSLFTALLALTRAFVAEREQRVLDGLVLTPCDRSAIWLGKVVSVLAFLVIAEAIALPAFALFFAPVDGATIAAFALADLGIAAVGVAARRHGGREPGAGAAPAAALPAARDSDRGRRRRARRSSRIPAATSPSSGSTTRSSRYLPGPALSTSLRNNAAPAVAIGAFVLVLGGHRARVLLASRTTPTRASPSGSSTSTCRSR